MDIHKILDTLEDIANGRVWLRVELDVSRTFVSIAVGDPERRREVTTSVSVDDIESARVDAVAVAAGKCAGRLREELAKLTKAESHV